VHSALASQAIIDQLMALLSKDSEEVNLQVKRLHAMLDVATMMDRTLNPGARRRGQDPDHRQSPSGDSANSLSCSLDERAQGQGAGDTQDIIHSRDAHDRIENCHRDRERAECEPVMRGTMISMAPTMTSPPNVVLRPEDIMTEESRISIEI
jgi:hypothetical protein